MHFEDIFNWQLKLDLGLISVADVQQWAQDALLNDINVAMALDICFLKNEKEVLMYIDHLLQTSEEPDKKSFRQAVALQILKEYFDNHLPKILDDQLDIHMVKLKSIAFELYDLCQIESEVALEIYLVIFDDQINLATKGNADMTPQMAYDALYQYLEEWIAVHCIKV